MEVRFKAENGNWYEIMPSIALHEAVMKATIPTVQEGSVLHYHGVELPLGTDIDIKSKISKGSADISTIILADQFRAIIKDCIRSVGPAHNNRLFSKDRSAPPQLSENDFGKVFNFVMGGNRAVLINEEEGDDHDSK